MSGQQIGLVVWLVGLFVVVSVLPFAAYISWASRQRSRRRAASDKAAK